MIKYAKFGSLIGRNHHLTNDGIAAAHIRKQICPCVHTNDLDVHTFIGKDLFQCGVIDPLLLGNSETVHGSTFTGELNKVLLRGFTVQDLEVIGIPNLSGNADQNVAVPVVGNGIICLDICLKYSVICICIIGRNIDRRLLLLLQQRLVADGNITQLRSQSGNQINVIFGNAAEGQGVCPVHTVFTCPHGQKTAVLYETHIHTAACFADHPPVFIRDLGISPVGVILQMPGIRNAVIEHGNSLIPTVGTGIHPVICSIPGKGIRIDYQSALHSPAFAVNRQYKGCSVDGQVNTVESFHSSIFTGFDLDIIHQNFGATVIDAENGRRILRQHHITDQLIAITKICQQICSGIHTNQFNIHTAVSKELLQFCVIVPLLLHNLVSVIAHAVDELNEVLLCIGSVNDLECIVLPEGFAADTQHQIVLPVVGQVAQSLNIGRQNDILVCFVIAIGNKCTKIRLVITQIIPGRQMVVVHRKQQFF